ncbi:MAG: primosomal protein N' [Steroidobacteraceae bacterium]
MLPLCQVAIDTPLRRLFDYQAPLDGPLPTPGSRVKVPFGRRTCIGIVVSNIEQSELEIAKIKRITAVIDPFPTLDPELLSLLRWAAEYYHHPLGEVLTSALPRAIREGAPLLASDPWWRATPDATAALQAGLLRRAPAQRALLERLGDSGCRESLLEAQHPHWRAAARALRERGWIERQEAPAEQPAPAASLDPSTLPLGPKPTPTAEQQQVLERFEALGDAAYHGVLLHGVTGSGKTEVYLRLAEQQLRRGRSVLVLVPEIGLTPQLVGRFAERFPTLPRAVLHSGLSDAERFEAWRRARSGEARLVIGTRSAVFAPLVQPGLLIVDEEHDASFKQQEGGFRYSARDLALVRARRLGIPVMLGSATPALETLHNVDVGRLSRLELPRRTAQAEPPRLRLIDLRQERVHAGLSTTAVARIKHHLEEQGQVLLFINRRGYAPTLACTACGWIAPCQSCDARMTVYRQAERLRCHHCGADRPLPKQCPTCGYAVKTVGQGTERIEETLGEWFPGIGVARLDRDVVRRQGELEAVVARVSSGAARLLVGTQMVAKGHDFPDVTLVIVLNADQGLFSTDFRAAERLAQTIVQVAGRAGRGSRPGEVLIQTEYPEHPLLRGLLDGGYDAFACAALSERREADWPPYAWLAALRASAPQADQVIAFLTHARQIAEPLCRRETAVARLLGPAPAAMARRADRHHAQLLIESRDRGALHRLLGAWLPQLDSLPETRRVRWALDVDPLELF